LLATCTIISLILTPALSTFSPPRRPPPRSTLFPYTTLFRSHHRFLPRPQDRAFGDGQGLLVSFCLGFKKGGDKHFGFQQKLGVTGFSTNLQCAALGIQQRVYKTHPSFKTVAWICVGFEIYLIPELHRRKIIFIAIQQNPYLMKIHDLKQYCALSDKIAYCYIPLGNYAGYIS